MLDNLEDAGKRIDELVQETFKNGKLQDYLDTLALMPKISYGNCLLLRSQLETVSNVLPKEGWEKYGKTINENAEPLKKIECVRNEGKKDFVLIDVYDISQTNSNRKDKIYNYDMLKNIIDNLQKKFDDKYKIKFENKERIDESIRQTIFTMNDFSNMGANASDFVDNVRLIVEPTIYTIQKHFKLEPSNTEELKRICMWSIDQDSKTLANGLKEIQKIVNTYLKEFESEEKKYLINLEYQSQETEQGS